MNRTESMFKALNQKIEEAETIDDIKRLLKVMNSILEGHDTSRRIADWAHIASTESVIEKWRKDNE